MTTAALEAEFGDLTVEQLGQIIRIAEMAERYEDMCFLIKKIVQKKAGADLDVEDRNLLSVAYKNVVGNKRAAWRTLVVDESDEEQQDDAELLEKYRKVVEKELEDTCLDVLGLLDEYLIPSSKGKNSETEVFFLKMAGDYYRYLCEIKKSEEYVKKTAEFYAASWAVAQEHLAPVHPTRLGLALNFSVCKYEILKDSKAACKLAKEAFDDAIDKLDDIEDASYKDATLIMQLLRDNLTLWTSESDEEE